MRNRHRAIAGHGLLQGASRTCPSWDAEIQITAAAICPRDTDPVRREGRTYVGGRVTRSSTQRVLIVRATAVSDICMIDIGLLVGQDAGYVQVQVRARARVQNAECGMWDGGGTA